MINFKEKFDGINVVAAIMHLKEAATLLETIDMEISKAIYQVADLLISSADNNISTNLEEFTQISNELKS
jgi:hypothetical protein